jgi:CheY-like chemotaxis protein
MRCGSPDESSREVAKGITDAWKNFMKSVLVVDDDADIRNLLCQLLTTLGYNVSDAENGEQGLKAYQSNPANVVLLDMFMPVKDGLETIRDLLQHDPNVRVIAMTGGGRYGNVGILKPAMALGARRLLYKPITLLELQSAIEETIAGQI